MFFQKQHIYTLAVENLHFHVMRFNSRQIANAKMYDIVRKYGLHLVEVWDDKHYKTYIFNNGVRIHINREL